MFKFLSIQHQNWVIFFMKKELNVNVFRFSSREMPQIIAPSSDLRTRMEEGGGVKTKTKRERERAMDHFLKFICSSRKLGGEGGVVLPVEENGLNSEVAAGEVVENTGGGQEDEPAAVATDDQIGLVKKELDCGNMTDLDIFTYFKE